MKILLPIPTILLGIGLASAQQKDNQPKNRVCVADSFDSRKEFDNRKDLSAHNFAQETQFVAETNQNKRGENVFAARSASEKSSSESVSAERRAGEENADAKDAKKFEPTANAVQNEDKEKFHWKPALIESGMFLAFQHGFRAAAQKSTRSQLGGPFFRDWAQSVGNLRGWRDGNNFLINYVGHPLQGGLTGRIFVNNSELAKKQEFGKSKEYWKSRSKALAWSAAWSAQFELGPVSEADIGNVGLIPKPGYSSMAYVDLVVTPVVGTGILAGEDAIVKYILKNWLERKNYGRTKIKILRSFLTPTTSIENLLQRKAPWKRDNRPF